MDIYIFSLGLGGVGLGVMAISGLSHQGHGHQSHGHDAAHLSHGQHGDTGHAGHTGHVAHAGPAGNHGHDAAPHHTRDGATGDAHGLTSAALWTLASPRVLFSVLLGFGATGMIFRGLLGSVGSAFLLPLAIVGGIAFERLAVRPLLAFLFGFASTPALTLDSTLLDEARAASGFDANGEGLVALELDGQVVQVLGMLRSEDRALGVRVRAGDRLRIEDVDGERHRCTVSFIARP
jgi:hypothetical protein